MGGFGRTLGNNPVVARKTADSRYFDRNRGRVGIMRTSRNNQEFLKRMSRFLLLNPANESFSKL